MELIMISTRCCFDYIDDEFLVTSQMNVAIWLSLINPLGLQVDIQCE